MNYNKKIHKNILEVSKTCREIEDKLVESNIPKVQINDIVVSVEEALSNIINYSTPHKNINNLEISLSIRLVDHNIEICLKDNGIPFNIKSAPRLDMENYLKEERLGGFGISLLKNLMDFVESQRVKETNILTMRKKVITS